MGQWQASGGDFEPIFSEAEIARRLEQLANEIANNNLRQLLVVAILKGSFVFAADLIRALHRAGLTPEVDFLTLSSYRRGRTSSGTVEILRDLDLSVQGRNVLLIDDVLDSGRTLAFAKDLLSARGAERVFTCVLLNKDAPRAVDLKADFHAFDCADEYAIGYGMDIAHRYRELPFIARLLRGA